MIFLIKSKYVLLHNTHSKHIINNLIIKNVHVGTRPLSKLEYHGENEGRVLESGLSVDKIIACGTHRTTS